MLHTYLTSPCSPQLRHLPPGAYPRWHARVCARATMVTLIPPALYRPLAFARLARANRRPGILPLSRRALATVARATEQQHSAGSPSSAAEANAGSPEPPLATVPTFQEAIFRLQQFWSSKGCVIWLPHNVEVLRPTSQQPCTERPQLANTPLPSSRQAQLRVQGSAACARLSWEVPALKSTCRSARAP